MAGKTASKEQNAEKVPAPIQTLRQQLELRLDQFKHALPSHVTPQQFVAVLTRAAMANNDLVLADRISFFEAALAAAIDGLMPDGKEGAMVIYNTKVKISGAEQWIKKVQWLPMIRGIITKLYNTGQVKGITVGVVYEGDTFRAWTDDLGEHIEFEEGEKQNREVIRRTFAAVFMKDGGVFVETMREEDIEKVRNASKSKEKGPWVDWKDEMRKKTVFKRLAKRLPVSREIAQVISRDDYLYDLDNLRDVTPTTARPKGLASRLDALADHSGLGVVPADLTADHEQPVENAGPQQRETQTERQRPDDKPADDDAAAYRAGRDARAKGMSRKTMPADYRNNEKLSAAWLEGFDAEGGEA